MLSLPGTRSPCWGGRWFRRWCCSGSHPCTPPGNLVRLHCFLPPPSPGACAPWKRQATHGTTPVTPARLLLLGYPLGSLCPSPCHIPLSHRSSCVGWGGRKGMVLEEETAHWRWERGGCATGHIVQISRRINVVHGGYVILHCQWWNSVVHKLNRHLSGSVASVRLVECVGEFEALSWRGTRASLMWRGQEICSLETRIRIPAIPLLNSEIWVVTSLSVPRCPHVSCPTCRCHRNRICFSFHI